MAKITNIKLPDAFNKKLESISRREPEIVNKMLKIGGDIAAETTKKELDRVVGNNTKYPSKSTGELQKSLGVSPVKETDDGYNVKIGFAENGKGTMTNAAKAANLEYGNVNGQAPKPFLAPAKRKCKKPVVAAMDKVFNEEISK